MIIWLCKIYNCQCIVQECYSSDTTSRDTSWVLPVIIFAHPFGNCWRPLPFWDLFFPQLSFFVLPLYVLFHPIFMARLPVPPFLIAGLHSALPNVCHCFFNDGGSNAIYHSKQCGKGNLPTDPTNACVLDVNSASLMIDGIDVCSLRFSHFSLMLRTFYPF
jgi:hypothetical protein